MITMSNKIITKKEIELKQKNDKLNMYILKLERKIIDLEMKLDPDFQPDVRIF